MNAWAIKCIENFDEEEAIWRPTIESQKPLYGLNRDFSGLAVSRASRIFEGFTYKDHSGPSLEPTTSLGRSVLTEVCLKSTALVIPAKKELPSSKEFSAPPSAICVPIPKIGGANSYRANASSINPTTDGHNVAPNLMSLQSRSEFLASLKVPNSPEDSIVISKTSNSVGKSESEANQHKKHRLKKSLELGFDQNGAIIDSLLCVLDKRTLLPTQVQSLSPSEFTFFKILAKKIYNLDVSQDLDPLGFVRLLNQHKEGGKPKRLEEELKAIFKNTLKHLMAQVKERVDSSSKVQLKKVNYTMEFYKYYFEKTYKEYQEFRDYFKIETPQGQIDYSRLNSLLIHPLTVNAEHITKITRSELFRTDLLSYIDNHLLDDYKETRLMKTKRILINFYELISKNDEVQAIEEFIFNHQMKLPWATKDLRHAVSSFKEIIVNSEGKYSSSIPS